MRGKYSVISIIVIMSIPFILNAVSAESGVELSRGQTVYVPIYSHIYSGNRERPFLLTATISIRNTDLSNAITILSVDYYDSSGKLIRRYLKAPVDLNALVSVRYVINESDTAGGSGAKTIIKWNSAQGVSPPIMESIMIGAQTQQGISFTSRGQVIKEGVD